MKKVSRLLFLVIIFLSLPVMLGLGCKNSPINPGQQPITLRYWSVFNDSDFFAPIISAYQQQNPNVRIEYKKLEYSEYETELLNALAAGRGPDIMSIYHTWYPRHLDKLAPAPANFLEVKDFEEVFVGAASEDLITDGKIYGLPLAIDNLVLFYNEDIFNNAGVVKPPTTWQELMTTAERITTLKDGEIKLSGVALGTVDNVNRATDILATLMMQSGSAIVEKGASSTVINKTVNTETGNINPGLNSLTFYTDFANPQKASFSWDAEQDYSVDAFSLGETAMMINYSYHTPTIKLKSPNLNFKVASLPQIDSLQKVNYPSFWGESVASTSANPEEAWKFLVFLASKSSSETYAKNSGKASARRDIIATQQDNPDIAVVATQNLNTRTWYQAGQEQQMEEIFAKMIRDVNLGRKTTKEALKTAETEINVVLRNSRE